MKNTLGEADFFFLNGSKIRGVAKGAPPEFGRSVNPIQTRGDILCPSYYCPRIQKAIYTSELIILL
jgi:hypothetical protein